MRRALQGLEWVDLRVHVLTPGALSASVSYVTNHLIASVPFYSIRHAWYRHALGWYVAPGAAIQLGQIVYMTAIRASGRRVSIDRGTVIAQRCRLDTAGGLLIGQHVYVGPEAWLMTATRNHDDPTFRTYYRPIVIDDYAWIGARAMILSGVTIGAGAVVLAGTVVMSDVEPYSIVSGVPAQVVGARSLTQPSYRLPRPPLFS